MNAPSKNTKCPCGSGKKYRKCHGKQRLLLRKAIQKIKRKEKERETFARKYGHARTPVSVMMGDKRVIAIGASLYRQVQEGAYGFMNAAHDCGLELFGVPYLQDQEQLPMEQRHPALQWMYTYVAHHERVGGDANGLRKSQTGAGAAWFRFGYDLFTIRDNARLLAVMKERLLKPQNFQAARHELAVAAMCISAGFDLQFEDEADNSTTHVEFVGTDRLGGAKIAVEAKSRHRYGVKGFTGGHASAVGNPVGVRGLVLDAYRKKSQYPIYAFIDVNLPAFDTEETYQLWLLELDQLMSDLSAEGYADPCPVNAVFFTNDPSHYLLTEQIGQERNNLWFKHYEAKIPAMAHPSADMPKRFLEAFTARIAPPESFPEN